MRESSTLFATSSFLQALFLLALLLGVRSSLPAGDVSFREFRAAARKLDSDATSVSEFLAAAKIVLKYGGKQGIRAMADGYAKRAPVVLDKEGPGPFMTFHGHCAAAFKNVREKKRLDEMSRLLERHREWYARLLLLDAAAFNAKVSLLDSALRALNDEHPTVVRRSLRYLGGAKKRSVVEEVIRRFAEVEAQKRRRSDEAEWSRTKLAFQSALRKLLKVELTNPADYRNYVRGRPDDNDLFSGPSKSRGSSGLTLFGAAVTGQNIVFVLDVSGSMRSTDPLPEGERKLTGRTAVGEEARRLARQERVESRRRITRAKKELKRVVRALPEDVRFNIIAYSTGIDIWEDTLVDASDRRKKKALSFIDELSAHGITVTDIALEHAFADLNIDTIYLLTDGAPTHVGSRIPGKKPVDADEIIGRIHERVKEINFLRDVRVFTLGFPDAEEDFLKKLAADNYGRYVPIE